MKVIWLLACVALARHCAGHIFRQRNQRYSPQMGNPIILDLEYINQQQRHYQRNEDKQAGRQHTSHQQDSGSAEHQRQAQEAASYTSDYVQPQHVQHGQQQSEEQYQQTRRYTQDSDEYQQRQQQKQNNRFQRYQQSIDSQENSRDKSQETGRIREYAAPLFADPTDSYRLRSGKQYKTPAYGDSISWRGVQIAEGPKVNRYDIEKIFKDAYDSMKHMSQEGQKAYHAAVEEAAGNEDSRLNATQLLNKYQYDVETHTIRTDDGYYLTLFRIPPKQASDAQQKDVVLLMHGLLGSADDWLLMGPGKSLAYQLADAGHEVWLGNARGSKYSRRHASKHPAQADFWQYSNDEVALHDLPAMIDYVLEASGHKRLQYVGYSQGSTAFFALAAARPEYNAKIAMMHALSPMVFMGNARSPLLRMIAPGSPFREEMQYALERGEFRPSKELVQTLGGVMCENEIGCKDVCSSVNFVMSGMNPEHVEAGLIPVIMGHQTDGASVRQLEQYGRAAATRDFARYDHGAEINEKVYGSRQPPQYDLAKVVTPVALYYSEADWLSGSEDAALLAERLPAVRDSYAVPEPHFMQTDFQFSAKAPELVYKRLIESMQNKGSSENYVY